MLNIINGINAINGQGVRLDRSSSWILVGAKFKQTKGCTLSRRASGRMHLHHKLMKAGMPFSTSLLVATLLMQLKLPVRSLYGSYSEIHSEAVGHLQSFLRQSFLRKLCGSLFCSTPKQTTARRLDAKAKN